MLVHCRVTPIIKFAGTHLYTWVKRGTLRVKCLAQEHSTMSPARARTQTTRSRDERTNHEATAPPVFSGFCLFSVFCCFFLFLFFFPFSMKKPSITCQKSVRIIRSRGKLTGREGIFVINRKSSFAFNITHS